MNETSSTPRDWLEAELEDTLDELYENEFSEPMLTEEIRKIYKDKHPDCLLYTSPSPRDRQKSRMPSSA